MLVVIMALDVRLDPKVPPPSQEQKKIKQGQ